MKYIFVFISSFFVYLSVFSQEMMKKRYYENSPPLGGDVLIKSEHVNVEKDEISKTFEIECSEEGAYYMGDEIDISYLPAGTYFVKITTDSGIVTKKVVKL